MQRMPEGIKTSSFTIISPDSYDKWDEMVDAFVERRNGKASKRTSRKDFKRCELLWYDCLRIWGLQTEWSLERSIRLATLFAQHFQIIKTKPGISRTSGAMIMVRGRDQEKYVFSDCTINVNPTAQELAEIAVDSAKQQNCSISEPKVAMMSFSTKGSAKSPEVDKVVEATKIAKN